MKMAGENHLNRLDSASEESNLSERLLDNVADTEVLEIYACIDDLKKKLAEHEKRKRENTGRKRIKVLPIKPGIEQIKTEEKIKRIEEVFNSDETKKKQYMIYAVCYDISENRLRSKISKYLEARGFHRIQKSVFIGNIHGKHMEMMVRAFAAIKIRFEEQDGIVMIPVSENNFGQIRVIGRELYLDRTLKREKVLLY